MTHLYRFTGPRITLDASELSAEQEEALREEGLDIEIEGQNPNSEEIDPTMEKQEKKIA